MNLTNYTDQDGFEIEIFEDYNGEKWLKKVKGAGSVFHIPEGITAIKGIETRYLDSHFQCTTFLEAPNLKEIYIPSSVRVIDFAAFDPFDSSVHIYCAAPEKPEGFADGLYYELYQEDYEFYEGDCYYGTWLTAGTLRGISDEEVKEGKNLPVVHWGVC